MTEDRLPNPIDLAAIKARAEAPRIYDRALSNEEIAQIQQDRADILDLLAALEASQLEVERLRAQVEYFKDKLAMFDVIDGMFEDLDHES